MLFTIIAFAAEAQTGNCIVFSPEGEYFYIALDNKFQNSKAHKNIRLTDIPEGDYWVTILFYDKNKKAIKSNMKLRANREISYMLNEEGGVWRLKEYSNIPKNQAKATASNQLVLTYNTNGVEVQNMKSANQLSKEKVQGSNDLVRVKGDINNDKKYEDKRTGKFKVSEKSDAPASTAPKEQKEPETGTKTIAQYIKIENADGTTSIVEERTTIIKKIVEKNGSRFLKTKKNKAQYPTDFECLPMPKEKFLALKQQVTEATDKLSVAQAGIKDQCMTPAQLQVLGQMITDDQERNTFAIAAKEGCADPAKFPFTIQEEPVIAATDENKEKESEEETVSEEEEEEEVVAKEEKEAEKPKTKAELKAALKAAKKREREAKKAARAKARAAKKAARLKAKEEKRKAREAKKAAKAKEKAAQKK